MELEETIYTKCPNCGGRLWMDDESSKKFFATTEDITALQFLAAATFWCAGCGRIGKYEELRTGEPSMQNIAWEGELVPIEEEWVSLSELQAGAIFETQDGTRAVKCGYPSSDAALCVVSLRDGMNLYFDDDEPVREIAI